MLQRTFKSAHELGISDIRHQALVTTLGMLERGQCVPFLYDDGCYCIRAHANQAFPGAFKDDEPEPKELHDGVFGMGVRRCFLIPLGVQDAIRILSHYLATGEGLLLTHL